MTANTKQVPVFLLGAGRSGTKFLRDIITTSDDVSAIPYDISYVWRYKNESCPHDELTPEMLTPPIKKYIKKTIQILATKNSSEKNTTILLEKSVPNTLRPAFIHAIYPDAKFIHLVRDGRAVSESALRLWQLPPDRSYLLKKIKYFPIKNYQYAFRYLKEIIKNKLFPNSIQHIWGPRYQGISKDVISLPLEIVCAKQWKRCVEISQSQLKHLDQENILEVSYEDLIKNSTSLKAICSFIGISDTDKVIEHYDKQVIRSNTKKWSIRLTDQQLSMINDEIGSLNKQLGYD